MKLLQDLSIIASNGYETLFKPIISSIISVTLISDHSKALQQKLILKEHAVLTVGNLVFDSKTMCTLALSHRTQDNCSVFAMVLIQLIHFKRSPLTYACLWTLNNLINHQCQGLFDDLLVFQIGSACKVIHSCYNYSVNKASKEKNTLFKYMKPVTDDSLKPNQII